MNTEVLHSVTSFVSKNVLGSSDKFEGTFVACVRIIADSAKRCEYAHELIMNITEKMERLTYGDEACIVLELTDEIYSDLIPLVHSLKIEFSERDEYTSVLRTSALTSAINSLYDSWATYRNGNIDLAVRKMAWCICHICLSEIDRFEDNESVDEIQAEPFVEAFKSIMTRMSQYLTVI